MFTRVSWLFNPITILISSILVPFLIAGFLFYVFNPIINYLGKKIKLKRSIGILIAILLVLGAYALIIGIAIPNLINELTNLINSSIKLYPEVQKWILKTVQSDQFSKISDRFNLQAAFDSLSSSYTKILQNILKGLTSSIGSVVGAIVSVFLTLFLVPIFLYYFLKDSHKMLPFIRKSILIEDKYNLIGLLTKLNATISRYIFGLAIDASFVFVMAMIGYFIIGIQYAFLFALFAAVTNLIPYIGPYIGVIPVILTEAFDHPIKALIAVAYVLVVQQIDGNVVFPKVVGYAIKVHPLTVMVLMMIAGSLYGLLGMVVVVPTYAMIKEIVRFTVELYRNIKKGKGNQIEIK
jgi:predicted PurR-regulated permease PerM